MANTRDKTNRAIHGNWIQAIPAGITSGVGSYSKSRIKDDISTPGVLIDLRIETFCYLTGTEGGLQPIRSGMPFIPDIIHCF